MPAKSKKQKNFMSLALAYKNGKVKDSDVSDEIKQAADSMTAKDLEDYANTPDSDIDEAMSRQQRMKLSRLAKKNAKKKARKRAIKMKKMRSTSDLKSSAMAQAKKVLIKKFMNKKPEDMNFTDKERLSKKLEKKKGLVKKIAKKLLPKLKKKEMERVKALRSKNKNESITYDLKSIILKEEYIENLQKSMEPKRKQRSKSVNVKYEGLDHRVGTKRIRTIKFTASDPNGSGKTWKQQIQIPDLREVIKQKKNQTLDEAIGMAVYAGDVKIACNCPDFKNSYEWMADAGDYGIKKQSKPPEKRNPKLEGSTCKHINAVFENIESEIPNISKDLRTYLQRRRK